MPKSYFRWRKDRRLPTTTRTSLRVISTSLLCWKDDFHSMSSLSLRFRISCTQFMAGWIPAGELRAFPFPLSFLLEASTSLSPSASRNSSPRDLWFISFPRLTIELFKDVFKLGSPVGTIWQRRKRRERSSNWLLSNMISNPECSLSITAPRCGIRRLSFKIWRSG